MNTNSSSCGINCNTNDEDRDPVSMPDSLMPLSDAMMGVLRRRADQTLCAAVQDQQTTIGNIRTNVAMLTANIEALSSRMEEFTGGTDILDLIDWVKGKQEEERIRKEMIEKLKQSSMGYLVTIMLSAFIAFGGYLWGFLWEKIHR